MFFDLKLCRRISVFFAFMGTLLFSGLAAAQRGMNPYSQAEASLPAGAAPVIDRLASLNSLPAGTWKMHSGDVAHGEAVDLDDSGWQTATPGEPGSAGAEWLRQTIEVPQTLHGYDLTGARIWFQLRASAQGGVTQIVYFNGSRVAMGENLEPIVLFDGAHPGEKTVVAVKLLATSSAKTFRGAELHIDFSANRPNPDDVRQEFLSAAVLLPSLAPGDSAKEQTLEDAIKSVDIGALDTSAAGDAETQARAQTLFDNSLKAAQTKLDVLRPTLQQVTFHLTGNSHIDAAWLWPWTEAVDVVRRTFGTALQLMDEYPDYTYTQSATQYNVWVAEKYPTMNDEIKQRIKEGRWEVVGGMWVEPDLNMPDGESLVRQLLVGKRWYEKNYGVDVRIGWNPDSFGYNWQLPQIYKKSGVDFFVTQKMSWNDTNQLPFKLF
jgi:alpha-mannosidase